MPRLGSLRYGLLIALSTVLHGFTATASAGSGVNSSSSSTTATLGEALAALTPEQKALCAHLRAKGAVFYGAWWCPACFQQKTCLARKAAIPSSTWSATKLTLVEVAAWQSRYGLFPPGP